MRRSKTKRSATAPFLESEQHVVFMSQQDLKRYVRTYHKRNKAQKFSNVEELLRKWNCVTYVHRWYNYLLSKQGKKQKIDNCIETNTTLYCSFCGKNQFEVDKLIVGNGNTFICSECVELCQDIIYENK